jgi:hypothetical protein
MKEQIPQTSRGMTDGTVAHCRSSVRKQLNETRAYSLRVKPVFGILIRSSHFDRLSTYLFDMHHVRIG